MEKNLYIVRGVPGSGKSTIAKSIAKSWQIFEADKYFIKFILLLLRTDMGVKTNMEFLTKK